MGQYYKTVIVPTESETGIEDIKIYKVDNDCGFSDWIGLKLMEHSYLNNEWTDSIAKFIYKKKVRMAHVGDYADEYPQYQLAYNQYVSRNKIEADIYDEDGNFVRFDYHGKYLLNYDKKLYIYFDKYKKESPSCWNDDVTVCPFTLLTALGNGRGGGDYYGNLPNEDLVGSWAWDEISIEDSAPADFAEYPVYFTEK